MGERKGAEYSKSSLYKVNFAGKSFKEKADHSIKAVATEVFILV